MIAVTTRSLVDGLEPIGLSELDETASLQTRKDRKYLVGERDLTAALAIVAESARVLEIDDRRQFTYRSTYFDTPAFDSYLGAVRGRPNRFKVRTRNYVDAERGVIEVKVRSPRGQTVKHRQDHPFDLPDTIVATDLEFLNRFAQVRPHVGLLRPTLTTAYRRSTLVLGDGSRVTIDADVRCAAPVGNTASIRGLVVETKSVGRPSVLDRLLWSLSVRPLSISKFGTGFAALHPELPSNKWRRILRAVELE
jgi:hypothetical protein